VSHSDNGKRTLIVLPTYNERNNISQMVEAIKFLDKQLDIKTSILIIDDNSPDGTGKVADELCGKNKDVFVVHREKKLGLGLAYIEGFKFALEKGFDYICEMDADFSHDPKYLLDFYREIKEHDLVIGSRYTEGISIVNWPMIRLVKSYFANKFVKLITGMPFTDCMGGYKCISTQLIRDIGPDNIISRGYVFQMEILYRAYKKGYRIKEIPIVFFNRKHGRSKMSKSDMFESFFIVLRLRFSRNLGKDKKNNGGT